MEEKRYHSLDALRASMMLLGIWLHTVVGSSRDGGWPYKDPHPTAIFDWTLALIHTFRMPLFMALAGFFGALLWTKRGRVSFVTNRLQRVALPFVLGWFAVLPLSLVIAIYGKTGSLTAGIAFFTSGAFLAHLHPGHLWFLEYLVVLYVLALIVVPLAERLPDPLRAAANRVFRSALASPCRAALFAAPSTIALVLMPGGFLEDPPGFLPVPRIVFAYAIPFAFGWLLHVNRDRLAVCERRAAAHVALALALVAGYLLFVAPHDASWWPVTRYVRSAAGALVLWLLSFGLTGLFLRHAAVERPLWRYLADGSYWMYIVHMPVVIACQVALASVRIPTPLKVILVVAASFLTLVVSYDLLARSTVIGVLLNGRRQPRRYFVRGARPVERPQAEAVLSAAGGR